MPRVESWSMQNTSFDAFDSLESKWTRAHSHDSILNGQCRPAIPPTEDVDSEAESFLTYDEFTGAGTNLLKKCMKAYSPHDNQGHESSCLRGVNATNDSTEAPSPLRGEMSPLSSGTCVRCEVCEEAVENNESTVLVVPQGKRVFECTTLDMREAKRCHEKCLHSWNVHPNKCKPCTDWHTGGKCRKEFSCRFCHLPHEEIKMQGGRSKPKKCATPKEFQRLNQAMTRVGTTLEEQIARVEKLEHNFMFRFCKSLEQPIQFIQNCVTCAPDAWPLVMLLLMSLMGYLAGQRV